MAAHQYHSWGRTRGPKNIFPSSTITPPTTFPTKKVMNFDGTDDFVEVADNDIFTFGNGVSDSPFSVQAWIQIDDKATDEGAIIGKYNANTASEWLFWQDNGYLRVNLYDDDADGGATGDSIKIVTNAAVLDNDAWHHVVMTYDGSGVHGGLKVYVDATLPAATTSLSGDYESMNDTGVALRIGSTVAGSLDFERKIANVAIFDVELTATEVTELYNQGKVKDISKFSKYSNTVAWWKLGDGDTLPNAIEQIAGNNGTVTNATLVDEPPGAVPGIFVTDGYTTENQRFLHLKITEAGNTGVPNIKVWAKSHAFGIDRWAELTDVDGVRNSSVTRTIDIMGADRLFFVWDNTGTNVSIAASCSTF